MICYFHVQLYGPTILPIVFAFPLIWTNYILNEKTCIMLKTQKVVKLKKVSRPTMKAKPEKTTLIYKSDLIKFYSKKVDVNYRENYKT